MTLETTLSPDGTVRVWIPLAEDEPAPSPALLRRALARDPALTRLLRRPTLPPAQRAGIENWLAHPPDARETTLERAALAWGEAVPGRRLRLRYQPSGALAGIEAGPAASRPPRGGARRADWERLPATLTHTEALQYLPFGADRLYELLKDGVIPSYQAGPGRPYYIPTAALRRYLEGEP